MRLSFLACLAVAICAASVTTAPAQRPARPALHPPAYCPERRSLGFCPYDSGWRPVRDDPFFAPLRPGDPQAQSGPLCTLSDSRGRALTSYETEGPAPALRIGGRLVRFRPARSGAVDDFVSDAGRLTVREGSFVARDRESDARRATLTFTDRRGRAHRASVRIDCGV